MNRKRKRGEAPQLDSSHDPVRLHLAVGWWSLLFFAAMGLALESLHGFKLGFYLDVSSEPRRATWTLAHAHGTLISVLNIVFALTLRSAPQLNAPSLRLASRALLGSLALMPAGFFLGGLWIHGGDPGIGILLVPVGGVLLLLSLFLAARAHSSKAE